MSSKETELLARVALFAGLDEAALTALAGRMRRRKMPNGTPIVYKGDPGGALYVLASGRVKIHQATASGDEVILEILGPGTFFGEMSLLDGQPRAADVSTLEPSELLILEESALRQAIMEQPAVAWTLLRVLSQRLREQNDKTEMLMTRDVAGRVADLLLRLAQSQGTPLPDGKSIRIEVGLTQSDIGALVGATRERVSRALSVFRKQKAIDWDAATGRWIVRNKPALAKRAEL